MEAYSSQQTAHSIDTVLLQERLKLQTHTNEEMLGYIATLSMFVEGESDNDSPELGWVEQEDFELIQDDPRILKIEKDLRELSSSRTLYENARKVSRCTEWICLFEVFTSSVSQQNAA